MISGKTHFLVERMDGFRFFLDPVFHRVLTNPVELNADERERFGVTQSEVMEIHALLSDLGLMETEQQ